MKDFSLSLKENMAMLTLSFWTSSYRAQKKYIFFFYFKLPCVWYPSTAPQYARFLYLKFNTTSQFLFYRTPQAYMDLTTYSLRAICTFFDFSAEV